MSEAIYSSTRYHGGARAPPHRHSPLGTAGMASPSHRGDGSPGMPKTPLLTDVAQYYLDTMLPDHRAQLERAAARATAEGRPLRIGTACSGTESPIVVFRALAKVLSGVTFEHVFSCEVCPKKREWIYDNFDVPLVFNDVRRFVQVNKATNK